MNEPVMNGSELLVQRFIDQELSPEERVQLLVRLGRDPMLRDRVIELETLVLDVGRLPKPIVPADFAARVLARTATPPPSLWRRAIDTLWAPRALQWNLAGAVAAAAIVLVAGAVIRDRLSRETTPQPLVGRGNDVQPPAAPTRVLVRLVVVQPAAKTVQAAGDFNGWNPARTPLEPTSNGAWTVTIPLEPGRYEYMFVVDGRQWIADPFAVEQSDDGFGARNAVLDVRPPSDGTRGGAL